MTSTGKNLWYNTCMIIGIDVDSVLADLMVPLNAFHNKMSGTCITMDDYLEYSLVETWGCAHQEVVDQVYAFYESPEMDNIPLIPGAIDGITYLRQKNELIVITSRPSTTKLSTCRWLNTHFPHSFKDIILSNQFSRNNGESKTKGEIGRELGVEVMIDDHIDYVEDCIQHGIKSFNAHNN